MPNRILREGILTSPRVAKLGGWAEEVFYRRLHSVVDDFGRYYADNGMLRAACYPRQLSKVSDSDIGKWLSACETAALVRVYPAPDGERYLEVLSFGQQVRAKKSKFPDPLDNCAADAKQMLSNAHLDVSVSVSEDVGDTPAARTTRTKNKKTPIPEDFSISPRVAAWAKDSGFGLLDQHLDAFKRKVASKGYAYVDWDSAFMEAVREDWAKLRGRTANGSAPPPDGGPSEWHETRSGVEARGTELGLGSWSQLEQFDEYKSRVMKAHRASAN